MSSEVYEEANQIRQVSLTYHETSFIAKNLTSSGKRSNPLQHLFKIQLTNSLFTKA